MVGYVDPRGWTRFPPEDARPRLEGYAKYRNLLMGEHQEVFLKRDQKWVDRPEIAKLKDAAELALELCADTYIVSNYCKMATILFANILFGSPPEFRVEDEEGIIQGRLDMIVANNMLGITNHQQEIEASHLGDAVYRVRWGRMNNWQVEGAVIEAIPADVYYPIIAPGNVKDNIGCVLAYPVEQGGDRYLYRETHLPGSIRYELNIMNGDELGVSVPLSSLEAYAAIASMPGMAQDYEEDGNAIIWHTDYPGVFVEHVPNWTKPDRYFGISDYAPDIISNQGAINALQTEIFMACKKHLDPKLALPEGLMQYDSISGKWYIQRSDLETIEVPADVAASLPRYITWDAKLDAARGDIDASFQAIMMAFGISPAIFGFSTYGAADSAAALKLRMTQTLWNIGQKRMYFDAALKNILYAAQYLDSRYGHGGYEPREVSITWPDPLPKDTAAEAQALSTMKLNGLIAHETAVARMQSISDDALMSEMEKIKKDRQLGELMQLAATGAVTSDVLLRAYRGEDITADLKRVPRSSSLFPGEE